MPPKQVNRRNSSAKTNSSGSQSKPSSTSNVKRFVSIDSIKPVKEYRLTAENEGLLTAGLDCCAFIVHCPTHATVLVRKDQGKSCWMPFIEMPPNQSWKDCALAGFCLLLAGSNSDTFEILKDKLPYKKAKCVQVLRLQLPRTKKFITRVIYYFKLDTAANNFKCCQKIAPHLEWFPMDAIRANQVPLEWGPELVQHCKRIPLAKSGHIARQIAEFSLEEAFLFVPRDPPRNPEEDMLKSLRITQTDVERLYASFLDHCYPSLYQSIDSFKCYMAKLHIDMDLNRLFAAFNYTGSGYLSFHELLLGLTCIEPSCRNGVYRVKFLFRYYNTDRSGYLSESQLKAILADLLGPDDADKTEAKMKEVLEALGHANIQLPVSEKAFVTAIMGATWLQDTSRLCRSSKAIFTQISRSIVIKNLKSSSKSKALGSLIIKRNSDVCPSCLNIKYDIATHQMCFKINDQIEIKKLAHVEVHPSTPLTDQSLAATAQQYSIECVFNANSAANTVLKLVREFNCHKGTTRRPRGLLQNRVEDLWQLLMVLHHEIDALLEAEFKCQKTFAPCYVIGDIHGNLEDLLSLERTLWKTVPCVGANYLFLGDYVDRGKWSLECALYLVAFKILCPNKVTMLRGNHEVRSLQHNYSYKRECLTKYGELWGLRIWELTNRMFDKLPLCAVLDNAIYCAHGGIPFSAKTLEQIAELKREIRDPQQDDGGIPTAWEILWSDPANMQDFIDACDARGVDFDSTEGFVFNNKRGIAYKFNEHAVTAFLRTNMLSHIIRAHEVAPPGYAFHFGTKCCTIFSSSHYCGNDNDCSLILADNQRLRVLHIDTANNASATDL